MDEVPGYSYLLAVPSPTKSVRRLFPCPFSVAGPQFYPKCGGNLPSPNDNDGRFPLGVGSGFRGTTSLRCLVRQVPQLAHKQSSSSRSLSSVPDAPACHHQDERGGGVSYQSPGVLPFVHPEQACAPASSLGTGQVFVPESGPCLRGPEHSGGILETETQVRAMDAEPPYCGSDLVKIPCGRGGPLCIAGVYVVAIAARRDSNDVPLGSNRLVSSFMRVAK